MTMSSYKGLRNRPVPCLPNKEGDRFSPPDRTHEAIPSMLNGTQFCVNGTAAGFPCENIDLESYLNIESLGGPLGEFDGAGGGVSE